MKFKKGDLVIYIDSTKEGYSSFGVGPLIYNNIYEVSHYNDCFNICLTDFAGFSGSDNHGYFPHRFKYIKYLTEELKFKVIKQKLGVQGGKV